MKGRHQWLFFVGLLLATSGLALTHVFKTAPDWINLPFQISGLIMMIIYIIINGKLLKQRK